MHTMSRRALLRGAAVSLGALAGASLLQACAPAAPSAAPTSAAAAPAAAKPTGAPAPISAPAPTSAPAAATGAAKPGDTMVLAGESLGDNYDPRVTLPGWG